MTKIFFFLALFCILASPKLRVHGPKVLREVYDAEEGPLSGYVAYNLANYGFNPYDHRLCGRVMYPVLQDPTDGEDSKH